ncbi:MAG: M23 family metallopeptidase [Candidatus Stygibacter frigidus]|nr:M23 family metallopeptidase [Candidatus Stygibacter frigidus]
MIKKQLESAKSQISSPVSFAQQELIDHKSQAASDNTEDLKNILAEYLQNQNSGSFMPDSVTIKNRFIPDLNPLSSEMVISQKFSDKHPGIDLAAPQGTEVKASAAGKIEVFEQDDYFGNLIIIEHFNGYYTFYGHLDQVFAVTGNFAEKGEVIGTVGSTGFSTGPHLHFSIRYNDNFIDPFQLIKNNEK